MKKIDINDFLEESRSASNSISFVSKIITEGSKKLTDKDIPLDKRMPVLPIRGMMIFPNVLSAVSIGRESSLKLVKESERKGMIFCACSQKDSYCDEPEYSDMYEIGVLARVVKLISFPGSNTKTALIEGLTRVKLNSFEFADNYYMGEIEIHPEVNDTDSKTELHLAAQACREAAGSLYRMDENRVQMSFTLDNLTEDDQIVNFVCANASVKVRELFSLLEMNSLLQRAMRVLKILHQEKQIEQLKEKIQERTRVELDKQQRDYYLRQEMEHIKAELGEKSDNNAQSDWLKFKELGTKKKWNEKTAAVFNDELEKMQRLAYGSPDYQVQYAYLKTFTDLPWDVCSKDNMNLKSAKRVLDKDHYGLEKVKERIIEQLAVLKMRGDFKSPIICLYGPPGVGKTSLGKSIAKAMKRKYVRMSLGGLHDEAEIRGHRKTYIGAMPGQIIKNIMKAGTSNPVFILDEIDKVTQDVQHGDPSSALLEVLDPEQNSAFHDNYLEADYDLSKVMFIATANNIGSIPAPLLDRMELIEVSGYTTEEKVEIAKRHLVPKELDNLGMKDSGVKISKSALEKIVENYTRESGVRNLDKKITQVLRKVTLKYAEDGTLPKGELKPADVTGLLGTEPFTRDIYQTNDYYGVVTGLAWTSVGGEILFIETSIDNGKGGRLGLTGNLGDVMKESATIALQFLKEHCDMLGVTSDYFDNHNIHIHVPEGSTPKDGPSAGITIATSLASAITKRKVRKGLAMTGEITLRGKVLPVGGIKEKILAAKRAGITDIIICNDNKKNIEDIPSKYITGVKFHYVNDVKEVLDYALLNN